MHRCDNIGLINKLYESYLEACFKDSIPNHLHVHVLLKPHLVHDSEELQNQVVLPQVISVFEHYLDHFIFRGASTHLRGVILLVFNHSVNQEGHLLTHEHFAFVCERFYMLLRQKWENNVFLLPRNLFAVVGHS